MDEALERTPLARGVSMALHESQSRLWENLVGRSRPFWHYFFPRVQEAFPEAFGDLTEDAFYRAVNAVQPSLIRVQADQVTYSLHIILRFELEREMIGGLDLRELPGIWNERMKDYLGIDVPDDARGVLQDVHWGGGGIGYFPTYALGNVVSLQIWERLSRELPDHEELFARGEFGAAARVAAPEPLPAWAQVHAAGDAREGHGRRPRPGPVRSLPASEGGRDLRGGHRVRSAGSSHIGGRSTLRLRVLGRAVAGRARRAQNWCNPGARR